MATNETAYIDHLKKSVYDKISADINEHTIDSIVTEDLQFHIADNKSASFQDYYFQTLNNEKVFTSSADFFRQFKKQYSLQGIDNGFLDTLEKRKEEILKHIRADKLVHLYFGTFNKATIKHKDTIIEKDLGSFFAKLVHTFRPDEYCALDNPIKNYFGLGKESFFISFLIISVDYNKWTKDHKDLVKSIRNSFKQLDKKEIIKHDLLTNLKLLDLIFWTKANKTEKKGSL